MLSATLFLLICVLGAINGLRPDVSRTTTPLMYVLNILACPRFHLLFHVYFGYVGPDISALDIISLGLWSANNSVSPEYLLILTHIAFLAYNHANHGGTNN